MWNSMEDELRGIETPPHAKLSASEIFVKKGKDEQKIPRGERSSLEAPKDNLRNMQMVKVAVLAFCVGILFLSALVTMSFQSDHFGATAIFGGMSVFILAAFIFWTELGLH